MLVCQESQFLSTWSDLQSTSIPSMDSLTQIWGAQGFLFDSERDSPNPPTGKLYSLINALECTLPSTVQCFVSGTWMHSRHQGSTPSLPACFFCVGSTSSNISECVQTFINCLFPLCVEVLLSSTRNLQKNLFLEMEVENSKLTVRLGSYLNVSIYLKPVLSKEALLEICVSPLDQIFFHQSQFWLTRMAAFCLRHRVFVIASDIFHSVRDLPVITDLCLHCKFRIAFPSLHYQSQKNITFPGFSIYQESNNKMIIETKELPESKWEWWTQANLAEEPPGWTTKKKWKMSDLFFLEQKHSDWQQEIGFQLLINLNNNLLNVENESKADFLWLSKQFDFIQSFLNSKVVLDTAIESEDVEKWMDEIFLSLDNRPFHDSTIQLTRMCTAQEIDAFLHRDRERIKSVISSKKKMALKLYQDKVKTILVRSLRPPEQESEKEWWKENMHLFWSDAKKMEKERKKLKIQSSLCSLCRLPFDIKKNQVRLFCHHSFHFEKTTVCPGIAKCSECPECRSSFGTITRFQFR